METSTTWLKSLRFIMEKLVSRLFNDPTDSDVVIKTKDGDGVETEFRCHKIILKMVSPVFKVMFGHEESVENKTNVVEISDYDTKSVKTFLKIAYGFKEFESLTFDEARFAIMICDKYDLDADLKENLGSAISKNGIADWDSAMTFAILASKFNVVNLKNWATDQLVLMYDDYPDKDMKPLKECPDVLLDVHEEVVAKKDDELRDCENGHQYDYHRSNHSNGWMN